MAEEDISDAEQLPVPSWKRNDDQWSSIKQFTGVDVHVHLMSFRRFNMIPGLSCFFHCSSISEFVSANQMNKKLGSSETRLML